MGVLGIVSAGVLMPCSFLVRLADRFAGFLNFRAFRQCLFDPKCAKVESLAACVAHVPGTGERWERGAGFLPCGLRPLGQNTLVFNDLIALSMLWRLGWGALLYAEFVPF